MKFLVIFLILISTFSIYSVDIQEMGKLIPKNHDAYFTIDLNSIKHSLNSNAQIDPYAKIVKKRILKFKDVTGIDTHNIKYLTGFADVHKKKLDVGLIIHGIFNRNKIESLLDKMISIYNLKVENKYGNRIYYFKKKGFNLGVFVFSSKKIVLGTSSYIKNVLAGKDINSLDPANVLTDTIASFSKTCGYIKIRSNAIKIFKKIISKRSSKLNPKISILMSFILSMKKIVWAINHENIMEKIYFDSAASARTVEQMLNGVKLLAQNYANSLLSEVSTMTKKNPLYIISPKYMQKEYTAKTIYKIINRLNFSSTGNMLETKFNRKNLSYKHMLPVAFIAGTMAAIAIPNFQKARMRARQIKAKRKHMKK